MNILELIARKRDGGTLNHRELEFIISGYLDGTVTDYQMAAMLMAIYIRGMNESETFALTELMRDSGEKLNFENFSCLKVDKHSTGGVGDKISFLIAPLLASFGFCCLMLSGRALGHTGGTLDKLESIPGFRTLLSADEFKSILKINKMVISGQTEKFTPADQKIYALRDATSTVSSIPLIAASIMSKKLAMQSDLLLLEVKCGSGAFLKTTKEAVKLARTMLKIAQRAGRKCRIIISDMSEPLGQAIGNSSEIIESIEFLKGNYPPDLFEITSALCWIALREKEKIRFSEAQSEAKNMLSSGKPLQIFKDFIRLQGGDERVCSNYQLLGETEFNLAIPAEDSGYLSELNSYHFGMALIELGGGRMKKDEQIDHRAAIRLEKKVGQEIKHGETICTLFSSDPTKLQIAAQRLKKAISISSDPINKQSKIIFYLDEKGLQPWKRLIKA